MRLSRLFPAFVLLMCAGLLLPAGAQELQATPPGAVQVVGDGVPRPLTTQAGDAARGRAIVTERSVGLCLLCHSGPFPEQRFQGNLAPSLAGVGSRMSVAQLRLRMVDSSRMNPETIMPSYYRVEGHNRVAAQFQGKTILSAQQIEDVVAFLASMRE